MLDLKRNLRQSLKQQNNIKVIFYHLLPTTWKFCLTIKNKNYTFQMNSIHFVTYQIQASVLIQGSIFWSEIDIYYPPFQKLYFSPSRDRSFSTPIVPGTHFALFLPILHLFHSFTSHFLSSSFPFLPFCPFSSFFFNTCHLFLFPSSYFSPKQYPLIFSPQGVFSNIKTPVLIWNELSTMLLTAGTECQVLSTKLTDLSLTNPITLQRNDRYGT